MGNVAEKDAGPGTAASSPTGVHLTGRVPLANAEDVFRMVGEQLGRHVDQIPDGETGAREGWILWQQDVFGRNPAFDRQVPTGSGTYELGGFSGYGLGPGVDPSGIELGPLGYLDAAQDSYDAFQRVRDQGLIPGSTRFQVSLPTPLAPVALFTDRRTSETIFPVYESALIGELRAIQDLVPAGDLAVQLDIANEVGMWERAAGRFPGLAGDPFDPWFGDVMATTAALAARVADTIDDTVTFGLHLCYGSYKDEHFLEPLDLSILTAGANHLAGAIKRQIDWVHMPVPIERDDPEYFAPLRDLRVTNQTKLYLGLIHLEDGESGARRRIQAAQQTVQRFGVATECGIASVHRAQLPHILALHASVAEPVRATTR